MAQKRFYGVKNHPDEVKNGIYDSWETCSEVVRGAKGVQYKGFGTRDEAEAFCGTIAEKADVNAVSQTKKAAVPEQPVNSSVEKDVTFDARKAMAALDYLKSCNVVNESVYASVKMNIGQKSVESVQEKAIGIDPTRQTMDQITMFVDGSYNDRTERAGFGVYIQGVGQDNRGKGQESVLYGSVPMVSGGRNVEGEVTAAWMGLEHLKAMGATTKPVTVYCDYEGIRNWADGNWRTNKDYTKAYAGKIDELRQTGMDIRFVHVNGHTGVDGNEIADRLSKMGCGVHFPKEAEFRNDFAPVPGISSNKQMDQPVHDMEPVEVESQFDDMEF